MLQFQKVCKEIHFPIVDDKMEGKAQCLVYLNIGLYMVEQIIMVSQDKHNNCIDFLKLELSVRKPMLQQLQLLCGLSIET